VSSLESEHPCFKDFPWRISYRSFSIKSDGSPVDILHDFYIPALQRAVGYDRVAGYFRSTSLAAASQGFSAFVGREGKARFIVGADLDLKDVRAILQGSQERLAGNLAKELAGPDDWPKSVANGVRLLAWMVARGFLEIKVAFRMHCRTGEPLAFESIEDGYVHMKWAIFRDASGRRIYTSGSLNESHTALVLNAENIDVHCDWCGETEKLRADEAERDFEDLWNDRNRAFKVLDLPEAVRRRLISLAGDLKMPPVEVDGSRAAPLKVHPPSPLELLRFALLRDAPRLPGGKYVGMETAPVSPWPHQAVVARRIIDSWPAGHLLCDEVGLGKTIEAGLAVRSLYLAGLAKRVLIVAPASLTQQWLREMESKFYLPFARALGGKTPRHEYLLPYEQEKSADSLYAPLLTILSSSLLVREERLADLRAARDFDFVLVDEAHYARRKNTTEGNRAHPRYGHLYLTLQNELRKKARSLALLTATPMQLDPVEVSDLLRLTRRAGVFQFDPSLTLAFYEVLGNLVSGAAVSEKEWEFLRKAILSLKTLDPEHWKFIERAVIDARIRISVKKWLDYGQAPCGGDRQRMLRLIFSCAPLSRVMLRHTRTLLEVYREKGQLSGTLASRVVLPLAAVYFTEQEREVYERLEDYCRELAGRMAGKRDARGRSAIGFYLSFLRLRFASSLFAIRETVRRRLERIEATLNAFEGREAEETCLLDMEDLLEDGDDDSKAVDTLLKGRSPQDLQWEKDHLGGMLRNLRDLTGTSSKMAELLRILDARRVKGTDRIRQTVIFTRFFDTLTDIVQRLQRAGPRMLIGTYSGQGGQYVRPKDLKWVGVEREIIKHRFLRGEIDVLVCTDAAAEGLNLQSADFLVNFDLPWNPMKVEQRIGRIDRIGQKNPVIFVANLCYVGSAEEVVYGRLWQRLIEAGAIVGTQQISLLPVTRDEFQELAENPSFAEKLEKLAKERALLFRKRTASREIPPQDLHEIYTRMIGSDASRKAPATLEDIWQVLSRSHYLQGLGCTVEGGPEKKILKLSNIPGVPENTFVTTSRETFEKDAAEFKGSLHFCTYGDPVFEALLDHLTSYDLPPCLKRLQCEIPELSFEGAGYAAATLDEEGKTICRLVTSCSESGDISIKEDGVITEADTAASLQSLRKLTEEDLKVHISMPQIEKENERAARSQIVLNYLIIRGLMMDRKMLGKGQTLFWREIESIEEDYKDRESLRIRHIPSGVARKLSGLLLDVSITHAGEDTYIDTPKVFLKAAIEAACREADAMRAKKSELLTDEVLSRLERMIKVART
jgi:ERCC4-related helicase